MKFLPDSYVISAFTVFEFVGGFMLCMTESPDSILPSCIWPTLTCFLDAFVTYHSLALAVNQVLEVLDKEIFEEEQRARLATSDFIEQGPQCLWTKILQHCREWGWRRWRLIICMEPLFRTPLLDGLISTFDTFRISVIELDYLLQILSSRLMNRLLEKKFWIS